MHTRSGRIPACPLLDRESEHAVGCVFLAGIQTCGRPLGLVGSVRILLALEAYCGAVAIDNALLAGHCAVKEIARINLDAGLIGVDRQGYAGHGACAHDGGNGDVPLGVKDPVVVITLAILHLDILRINTFSYHLGLTEVKRSAFDRDNFTGCHEGVIDRGEARCVDLERLVGDGVGGVAGKVEI